MRLKKQEPLPRGAGVLLAVSSLPSPYGIGTFGREAYAFVDFLKRAGQRYWQVLPLGPTSVGDSPYQSFSAFAGNPYFIDLDLLAERGLLTREELQPLDRMDANDPTHVQYGRLFDTRFPVLRQAYARSQGSKDAGYAAFCVKNEAWLRDYAAFMAVKTHFGGRPWLDWPDDIRLRRRDALERLLDKLRGEAGFWMFCQYHFALQWERLKAYANANGVQIIGDIPIYAALDSADAWVNARFFQMDADRRPVAVAGVPPDLFSNTGQLWGNPLYNWTAMRRSGFSWWKARMRMAAGRYDVIRIDHFIGIERYYAIPAGENTAIHGAWKPGPGQKLLAAFDGVLHGSKIIAEDLGAVTPAVRRLKEQAGYPGMKVLEFAFDSGPGNTHLPVHYERNCVVYGGTHDNETLVGFFRERKPENLAFARRYLGVERDDRLPDAVIRAAYASVADTAILQMQDLLGLDNSARMNHPSTIGGNWQWRLLPGQLTGDLAARMHLLAETYGRIGTDREKTGKGAAQ